jgi:hypothetical protein|tara:strand:+ start:106 stop:270 length:165 start_codon:yes stop_codon:yes gene_type:complete
MTKEPEKIRPLTLEIDKELWRIFKINTPRSQTLNDRVVELIENDIKTMRRGVHV